MGIVFRQDILNGSRDKQVRIEFEESVRIEGVGTGKAGDGAGLVDVLLQCDHVHTQSVVYGNVARSAKSAVCQA